MGTITCGGGEISRICKKILQAESSALERPTAKESENIKWLLQMSEGDAEVELVSKDDIKRFSSTLRVILKLCKDVGILAGYGTLPDALPGEREQKLMSAWIDTVKKGLLRPLIKPRSN
jgi:hypothetical protein